MDKKTAELPSLLKALGDKKRLEILIALRLKELCACQLIEIVKIQGPALSKHLAALMKAGLISRRQEGKWAFFSFKLQIEDPGLALVAEQICLSAEAAIDLGQTKALVENAALHIKCE